VKGLQGFLMRVSKAESEETDDAGSGPGAGTSGPLCGYRCGWPPRELTHFMAGPGPSSAKTANAEVDSGRYAPFWCPTYRQIASLCYPDPNKYILPCIGGEQQYRSVFG
jgi:hypothetical protein